MTEQINVTNFQEGLLELSKETTGSDGNGGNKQELELDLTLAEALEELSEIQQMLK